MLLDNRAQRKEIAMTWHGSSYRIARGEYYYTSTSIEYFSCHDESYCTVLLLPKTKEEEYQQRRHTSFLHTPPVGALTPRTVGTLTPRTVDTLTPRTRTSTNRDVRRS